MILSILICTLPERKEMFEDLANKLFAQKIFCEQLVGDGCVEILTDHRGREVSTGTKRNDLIARAKGIFCVFIDDDDSVPDYYMETIILNAREDIDCFAINGTMTTNGQNEKQWFISLGMPYKADWSTGNEIYLRYPNHITPIRTDIAKQFKFADVTIGEDFDWATRIQKSGLLKTQALISKPMYHYRYIQK